jgi:hypothetical protein
MHDMHAEQQSSTLPQRQSGEKPSPEKNRHIARHYNDSRDTETRQQRQRCCPHRTNPRFHTVRRRPVISSRSYRGLGTQLPLPNLDLDIVRKLASNRRSGVWLLSRGSLTMDDQPWSRIGRPVLPMVGVCLRVLVLKRHIVEVTDWITPCPGLFRHRLADIPSMPS